jgi:hypothetical protein
LDQASSGAAVKDARFIRAESAVVTPDGWGREGQTPVSVSDLRLSICDISSDHLQIVAGGFERLFGIMVRNKPGVIVKSHIVLPPETIKDDQQTGMFLVDT